LPILLHLTADDPESVTACNTPTYAGRTWQPDPGGAGSALPPLFTTAVAEFRVAGPQALDTSGGT
jgi:hypothetical protein